MGDTMELTMDLWYEMNKDWIRIMRSMQHHRGGALLLKRFGDPPFDPYPWMMMAEEEATHIQELLRHSIWENPNPQPAAFLDLLRAMRTVAEDHLARLDREIEALESELDVGKEQE